MTQEQLNREATGFFMKLSDANLSPSDCAYIASTITALVAFAGALDAEASIDEMAMLAKAMHTKIRAAYLGINN